MGGVMDIVVLLLVLGGGYYLMSSGQLDQILTGAGLPALPPPFGSGQIPERKQAPAPTPTPSAPAPRQKTTAPAPSGPSGGGPSAATGTSVYKVVGSIASGGGVTLRGGGTSNRDNLGYPCNKCAREATWIFKPGTGGDYSLKLGSHGDEGGKETLIELGNIKTDSGGGEWQCEGPHMTYNGVSGGSGSGPAIGGKPKVGLKAVSWPTGATSVHHEIWYDETGSGGNWKKVAEFTGSASGCNAITCPVPGSKCQDTLRLDNVNGHQFMSRSIVEIVPGSASGGAGKTTAPSPTTPAAEDKPAKTNYATSFYAPRALTNFVRSSFRSSYYAPLRSYSYAANTAANRGLCISEGGTWTGTCCSCPNRFCKNKCTATPAPKPVSRFKPQTTFRPIRNQPTQQGVLTRPVIPRPILTGCKYGGVATEGAAIGGGFIVDHGPEDRAQWSAKHPCLLGEEASAYFCINPASVTDDTEEISIKMRGGAHTGEEGSPESYQGCCYIMGVKFSGLVNAQVECPHPRNAIKLPGHEGPGRFNPGSILGKRVGVLMRCWPVGGVDRLDCYLDLGTGWKLFHSTTSREFYGKCNGLVNGGLSNMTFFRIDNVEGQGDPYDAVGISNARFRPFRG